MSRGIEWAGPEGDTDSLWVTAAEHQHGTEGHAASGAARTTFRNGAMEEGSSELTALTSAVTAEKT